MKQRILKNRILLLALALLLLIPMSITLAKYTAVNYVGRVPLNITVDPPVLDASWKNALSDKTAIQAVVVGSFNEESQYLPAGMTWGHGKPVGQKLSRSFTKGVRLFEVDGTAYILARKNETDGADGTVVFPRVSLALFSLSNVEKIQFHKIDTSQTEAMFSMFGGCSSLKSVNLSSFNTQRVTIMSNMFSNCSSLETVDLSSFKTQSATSMEGMFAGCSSLKSVNLSSFKTQSVTIMSNMFSNCSSLETVDLSSFNAQSVTDMGSMFARCSSLKSLDLSSFNAQSVTKMEFMFLDCSSLETLDLSTFNTSNVTSMTGMFDYCTKLKQVTLGKDFQFKTAEDGGKAYLPSPSSSNIPGAEDGIWYPEGRSIGYNIFSLMDFHNENATTTTYYAVKSEALAASGTGHSLRSAAAAPDPDEGLSGGQNLTDDPVTPVDPAAPVDPIDPVTPVDPTDPEDPTDPDDPVTTGEETGMGASQDNPTTTA